MILYQWLYVFYRIVTGISSTRSAFADLASRLANRSSLLNERSLSLPQVGEGWWLELAQEVSVAVALIQGHLSRSSPGSAFHRFQMYAAAVFSRVQQVLAVVRPPGPQPETSGSRHAWSISEGKRLLLYLQLDQPPRDATEAGLQQAVIDDESKLSIYCDYLEEQSDPVVEWLRNLTNNDA